MSQNENELVKVASMYYEEGMTQAEIARTRGVSRSLISKYLIDAKKSGIVEVVINSSSVHSVRLERELEKKYHLSNAMIIDSFKLKEDEANRITTQQAALLLEKLLQENQTIGVSWGRTIRKVAESFPYTNHTDTVWIPLIGGMSDQDFDIQSNQLTNDFAIKCRGQAKYLYAPSLVSNDVIFDELVNNAGIKSILQESQEVDLALLGISTVDLESNMRRIGYLTDEDVAELKAKGAVGVINSRFFDRDGQEVDSDINRYSIGLTLDEIRQIPYRLGVVYGEQKAEAVEVALRTQLMNSIVTTDTMAETILNIK